jgi:ubiquinone/menaquinone biosynthesis C-methylase UbiE
MDAEKLEFSDGAFDIVYESGVLHHLNFSKAYSEIARVLNPRGEAICIEALRHNPIIQYYRRLPLICALNGKQETYLERKIYILPMPGLKKLKS